MSIAVALLLAFLVPCIAAESSPAGLSILESASKQYADAKSYHIEAVREHHWNQELEGSWGKETMKAIVAPNGRYRYEGRSGGGAAVLVSDGRTQWDYHVEGRVYTEKHVSPKSALPYTLGTIVPREEDAVSDAEDMMGELQVLGNRANSADLLADEDIQRDGREIRCYVVRVKNSDLQTRRPGFMVDETIWIDQSRTLIVKRRRTGTSFQIDERGAHIPASFEEITIYPVVELNEQEPASTFTFLPANDAKLVNSFPKPRPFHPEARDAKFLGTKAPDVSLRSTDGRVVHLSAYRGKPVFIDFWATSCAPCVALTPDLKRLYQRTAAKGLVWMSIDNDADPDAASAYLKKEQISWPNYHDDDGLLGEAFGLEGIPLGILIDAAGKVAFYETGYDIANLRTAIAKLHSPIQGVAPSPVAHPK